MPNKEDFKSKPRDYALELVEEGLVSADKLLLACLVSMSYDDVRDMLEANEMSPRFDDDDDESDNDVSE